MNRWTASAIAALLVAAAVAAFAVAEAGSQPGAVCGRERWAVKTGTDLDVALVANGVRPATVEQLRGLTAPLRPNARQTRRFGPTELAVVEVSATLRVIKREADGDYHLVIADPATGHTMIAEAPDPACAVGSRFAAEIAEVRRTLDGYFGGPLSGRRVVGNVPVTIIGVPFFDALHGQEGLAPSGIELHPILSIRVGQ